MPPSDSRLNQMFGHARKRCQATPIVRLVEMTSSQIMAETTLIIAMVTMIVSSVSMFSSPVG